MKLLRRIFIYFIPLIFSSFYLNAQTLQLADIYNVFFLDSLTLQRFATYKNFELKKVIDYGGGINYTFKSIEDSAVTFERSYSNAGNDRGTYFFNNYQDWKSIKDSLKVNGFKHDRGWESFMKDNLHEPGEHEKFMNNKYAITVDIGNTWIGKNKYCISIEKRTLESK